MGDPSGWAHEYYTALATGQVGQDPAFSLYTGLTRTKGGTYGNDVGTSLKLSIPDVSKQVQKGSEEEILLGSTTLTMNGQGCRFVAIVVDKEDLKNLPDGVNPKVECEGASVTVLSTIKRDVSNHGKSLTGLKGSADSNALYLVVVISKGAVGTSNSFEVKVVYLLKNGLYRNLH